jgi:hypothetical protein
MFPLNYTATIQRANETTERSGQKKRAYADLHMGVKCLFLETSGSKIQGPTEGHRGVYAFYVGPETDIEEGDYIIDIKTKLGAVIETGPLYVDSVKKVADIFGSIHHLSIKLKGVS